MTAATKFGVPCSREQRCSRRGWRTQGEQWLQGAWVVIIAALAAGGVSGLGPPSGATFGYAGGIAAPAHASSAPAPLPSAPSTSSAGYLSGEIDLYAGGSNPPSDTIRSPNGLGEMVMNPSTGNLWIGDSSTSTVAVYNITTRSVQTIIDLPRVPGNASIAGPVALAIDPAHSVLYASPFLSDFISVINTTSQRLAGTFSAGANLTDLVWQNGSLYASDSGANTIDVIAPTSDSVVSTIPVGADPVAVSGDPVHHRLYVLEESVHRVAFVNSSSRKLVQSVTVGTDPTGLAYDAGNRLVYVANRSSAGPTASSELEVVQPNNATVERTIVLPIAGAERPVYLPAEGEILVANAGPMSPLVNDTNNSVTYDPTVGMSSSIAVYDAVTASTFVLDPTRLALGEYNGPRLSPTGLFPLGGTPAGFAFDPSASELFLTDRAGGDVVGVNVSTDRVVGGVGVGDLPEGIAYRSGRRFALCRRLGLERGFGIQRHPPHSGNVNSPERWNGRPRGGDVRPIDSGCLRDGLRRMHPALPILRGRIERRERRGQRQWRERRYAAGHRSERNARGDRHRPLDGRPRGDRPESGTDLFPIEFLRAELQPDVHDRSYRRRLRSDEPDDLCDERERYHRQRIQRHDLQRHGFGRRRQRVDGDHLRSHHRRDARLAHEWFSGSVQRQHGGPTPLSGAFRPIAGPEGAIGYSNLTGFAYLGTAFDRLAGEASTLETLAPSTGGPLINALTVAPDPAEVGRPVTFTVNASGGSGPLSYHYVGLHSNCFTSNSAVLTCTPNATGDLGVSVVITDGIGRQVSTTVLVPILAGLLPGSVTLIEGPTLTGELVTFSAATTGGVGPYEVRWGGLPTGCAAATSALEACNATQTGIKTITANVTDADGATASEAALQVVFRPPLVVILAATRVRLDVGQSLNLTATVSGGTGGYTFVWSGLPTGCSANGTNALACSPKVSGNWTVTVTATDAGGFDTGVATVVLESFGSLWVSVPTSSKPSIDLGQMVTFNTRWSGGAAPYAFLWGGLPVGCAATVNASLVCQPTRTGTFHVSIALTDGNANEATNASLNFTVFADPVVRQIQATPSISIDVGQLARFYANMTGGSGGFQYAWNGLPPGCLPSNSAYLNCTPVAPGPTVIRVTVFDSNGVVANGSLPYVVYSDPTILRVNTTPSGSVDVGQRVTFDATVTGGSGGDAYAWSGLPSGCAGVTASFSCTPTTNGSFLVRLSVTDSNQFSVNATGVALVVDSDPTVLTPAPSVTSADVGQAVTFSTAALGGSGGYAFAWSGLPGNCTGAGSTIRCGPLPSSGNFSINVSVIDSNREIGSSGYLFFPVYGDPQAGAPSSSRSSADIGQNVSFLEISSGGAGGYTYLWSGLPSGCTVDQESVSCPIMSAARYSVEVEVTDSNGAHSLSPSVNLTTFSDPSAGVPSANRTSADVGQSMTFAERDSGGAGPLDVAWVGLPPGCQSTGTSARCILSVEGNYSVRAVATDQNGLSNESGPLEVTVDSPFIVIGITSSSNITDVASPVTLAFEATGGSGAASYVWSGLPTGCTTADIARIRCDPTSAGSWSPEVEATDSNGYVVTGADPALVVEPSPTFRSAVASPSSILLGSTIRLTASMEGGIGPYSFNWSGLPPGCVGTNSAAVSCHPSAAGSYSVGLVVTDDRGEQVSTTIAITVGATFLGLPASEGYGLVAAASAIVVILLVAFLMLARRRSRRNPRKARPARAEPEDLPAAPSPVVPRRPRAR